MCCITERVKVLAQTHFEHTGPYRTIVHLTYMMHNSYTHECKLMSVCDTH